MLFHLAQSGICRNRIPHSVKNPCISSGQGQAMVNKYEAHGHNGKIYDVTTDLHHDDHSEDNFKTHLGRIIDGAIGGTVGGVTTAVIVRKFIFKGK
jgi:hypothetical protein